MIGLKIIKEKKKYNQQKIADVLNITTKTLYHYESGLEKPNLDLIVKMSRYFNVSIDYLITGEEFKKR